MQILKWLLKIEEPPKIVSNSTPINQKQGFKDQNTKSKHIVLFTDCGVRRRHLKSVEKSTKLNCEDLSLFRFLQRKDISRSFFYHTLNLKRVDSVNTKKEEFARGTSKADSAGHGGNKILPITDSTHPAFDPDKKENINRDKSKTKTISRMKELLKWAAAAKAPRGGKYGTMRRKSKAAAVADDDDRLSNESPKISFRWDTESCRSTTSSVYSAISSALKNDELQIENMLNYATHLHVINQYDDAGTVKWITTDSEFVVLEL